MNVVSTRQLLSRTRAGGPAAAGLAVAGLAVTSLLAACSPAPAAPASTAKPTSTAIASSAASAASAGSTASTTAPASTVSLASPASMLGAGQTGPRSAVPWRQVGPGWELVQYTRTSTSVLHTKAGPTTLYLVDPKGGRYQMDRWTGADYPSLLDWSGDKARALLSRGMSRVEQLNLATGGVSRFTIRGAQALGYTRPNGSSVLGSETGSRTIVEYGWTGQREKVLGPVAGPGDGALESPGGGEVAIAAVGGLKLVSSSGHVIRSLRAGASKGWCQPARWWSKSVVLASCSQDGNIYPTRMWRIPVSGARPTALTPARTGRGADPLGDVNAWQLSSGLYLQAPIGCGTAQIVRQQASGQVKLVTIPGTRGTDDHVITARGGRLLVRAATGCSGSDSLLWFNPGTGQVQMLLKAPAHEQGVVSVVPFYARPGRA
jgi:hypothetical protein